MSRLFFFAALAVTVCAVSATDRVAVARLVSANVTGTVTFTETADGVRVTGQIEGLAPGNYGFHIHELGDVTTCLAAGGHYNPDTNNHGGPTHDERHVGDLGNVVFQANGLATIDFVDRLISLRDRNNILGRSVVLHEGEDDLGKGGNEGSLTTGNAGARVACAVIGISPPLDAWTSAAGSITPLVTLLFSMLFVALFKY